MSIGITSFGAAYHQAAAIDFAGRSAQLDMARVNLAADASSLGAQAATNYFSGRAGNPFASPRFRALAAVDKKLTMDALFGAISGKLHAKAAAASKARLNEAIIQFGQNLDVQA